MFKRVKLYSTMTQVLILYTRPRFSFKKKIIEKVNHVVHQYLHHHLMHVRIHIIIIIMMMHSNQPLCICVQHFGYLNEPFCVTTLVEAISLAAAMAEPSNIPIYVGWGMACILIIHYVGVQALSFLNMMEKGIDQTGSAPINHYIPQFCTGQIMFSFHQSGISAH